MNKYLKLLAEYQHAEHNAATWFNSIFLFGILSILASKYIFVWTALLVCAIFSFTEFLGWQKKAGDLYKEVFK